MPDLQPFDVHPGRAVRPPRADRTAGPTIWAVASGKGGVGKSVLTSSLAVGLAQTGPRAVAVDLDHGGANLHTLLGCERAPHTLSDFASGRVRSLDDVLAGTTVPGVRLLSGARAALDAANASRAQTQKILRGLARIDAGHVVLDLGAGSSFHTLDAFVAADRRLVVVTPEPTAIENACHFLKAAFFRALRNAARDEGIGAALASVLDEARRNGATPRELVEAASRADARAGAWLRARVREFEVDLVVNRADPDESDPGAAIATAARAHLGTSLRFAGSLADDASVPAAVDRGVPVMQLFPAARFCRDVQALVASLFASEPSSATRAFVLALAPARAEVSAPLPEPPPLHPAALGRYLRERREQLGLDLRALHERTRIRHHYLEAIEAEHFAALPPDVFLREYVRQVAHALGISDPVECARRFVAKAHASRCGVAMASAVAACAAPAPKASTPSAARPIPSADELLAAFDDEPGIEVECAPELEALAPAPEAAQLPARVSAAEVREFLLPSSAIARRRLRRERL
jgi:flagellar biosynthesis protein FlhG